VSGSFAQQLAERAQAAGLTLDETLSSGVQAYFELLRRWNRRINLTGLNLDALTTDGIDRLFIEPLIAARHVAPRTTSIIDLGSGGGSPALPLALAARASVTMVESKTKKSVFLREAARELGLTGTVLTVRYEEALEREELLGAFDTLSCRAVRLGTADLAKVAQFVRSGGRLLLFRSEGEANALTPEPPLSVVDCEPLPGPHNKLLVLQRRS
jgi:16S rRNA (guanine527-N7)-methyltransferase